MTSDRPLRLTPTDTADTAPRTAIAIEAAITSVKAGRVSGWVKGADRGRLLALYVGRRRVATAHQTDDPTDTDPTETDPTAINKRAAFTFDARTCPPDLLARQTLVIDVAILGDRGTRIASTEVPAESLLRLEDLVPLPTEKGLKGCIDQLGDNLLRGWVCDPARPERRLELFVFTNARYQGKYVADQPRPDLAAIGHGDGTYGFTIPLSQACSKTIVVAGDPEYWPIPPGAHALSKGSLRTAHKTTSLIEAFARALTTEPFPKKAFVINQVKQNVRGKQGIVPDAFAADYVILALECLRHEMVAAGETMTKTPNASWRRRLKTWIKMRIIGTRIRRLEDLAITITETPRLLKAAAKHRKPDVAKKPDVTKKVSINGLTQP